MTLADLQRIERDHVMGTYARHPVEFVRGAGTRLWDDRGTEYLDFLTGIAVAQIGHCHPALVEALGEQAARLMHVSNLFYTEPAMRLARRLSERSLGGKVFLANSGAEATEVGLKLSRLAGKRSLIAMHNGFHGKTLGALSATARPVFQHPFHPLLPDVSHVPFGDAGALATTLASLGGEACVIVEPVQGEAGVRIPDRGFLRGVSRVWR